MGKKENHQQDLSGLFEEFFETRDAEKLMGYMISNSNLPGRRANLELAEAFADMVAGYVETERERLWPLCTSMAKVSADEAPVNAPQEFIPFCGTVGIGSIGSVSPRFFEGALTALKALAHDPRWRMREAVRMGLQRLLAARNQDTLTALQGWIMDGDPLEMRAAAATVAEPAMLKEEEVALSALRLHGHIMEQVLKIEERKSEAFKTLRQALGYTLSVVVHAVPKEGFEFMAQLIHWQDADVLWVIRQNLKKGRLVKNFPQEVESIKELLLSLLP